MSRSKWKGPFQDQIIFKYTKQIKIFSRTSVISASFIDRSVLISTGKGFKKVYITRNHIGYKFGEFAFTRIPKKIKKQPKKNKKR